MVVMQNFCQKLFCILVVILSVSVAQAENYIAKDGTNIDFAVSGAGEPLVMLHSGMMSRDDMAAQIDYFSNNYKVIAIDAREQGRSGKSEQQISYELMASDVIGVMDHLNIEKFNLFGQSDGAITALMVTHMHPQRVEKQIIHGAVYHYDAYPQSQRDRWKSVTWDKDSERDNDPNGFPGMAIESYLLGRKDLADFESHYQEMAMMWATSPALNKTDLNNINIPTLVIVGDHYDISISHTVEMHEALANSELFVVPGATHFVHQEKPDLLHRVMHDFLN
ncbi:alpha/beta fold hydrolase [Pseudemcibacter aquimaris]|uniref:alpha/beta fold hydrolase n=1 Tax=Pseudemcibacter aquimaris TaxID=2857064 RepID=UPI002012FFCC|nr:alpha/beta hydrolase [Pseudemcibacter aquimaris]MCC3860764.1 alpha/beta hydrolase [Pseudemcibacter aquimaris]WDU59582.1 alpha/beta hydrolase [Pseudemcibacter aquimaris]